WIVHEVQPLPPLERPLRPSAVDERTKAVLFPGNQARDFRRSAVVETAAPLEAWRREPIANPVSASNEACRITHYDPQRIVVEADPAAPGLLIVSDAWYPGWKATVTSDHGVQPVPIYRTNRVFRGVWLTAGKQTVEFRFR